MQNLKWKQNIIARAKRAEIRTRNQLRVTIIDYYIMRIASSFQSII